MTYWKREPRTEPFLCEYCDHTFDRARGFDQLFDTTLLTRCNEPAIASHSTQCNCGCVTWQFYLCQKHREEQEARDKEYVEKFGPDWQSNP